MDSNAIESTIRSGDTEAVNDLLDELDTLSVDEKLALFRESYDIFCSCMDSEDGYSRQAVVRVVSTLDPATARLAITGGADSTLDPNDATLADQIERAGRFYRMRGECPGA